MFKALFTFCLLLNISVNLSYAETRIDVSSWDRESLYFDGSLTPHGVLFFLWSQGLIRTDLFPGIQITEQKLAYEEDTGAKIYFIKALIDERQKQIFVLKYFGSVLKNSETFSLEKLNQHRCARVFSKDRLFPRLCLMENGFAYEFQRKIHRFALLHSAQGSTLQEFLETSIHGNEQQRELSRTAFFKAGVSAAKFHEKFAVNKESSLDQIKTIIHGDLHARNVFYDPGKDQVYWIDNETVADSFHSLSSPKKDIQDLIKWLQREETPATQAEFQAHYREFLRGYSQVFTHLKNELMNLVFWGKDQD